MAFECLGVVLDVSMSSSAGPLVRGNRSDRGSHVVSHNFFSVPSVATFLSRISMANSLDKEFELPYTSI